MHIMRFAHVGRFRRCDCEVFFFFLHYRWLVDDMVVVCLEGFVGITPLLVVRRWGRPGFFDEVVRKGRDEGHGCASAATGAASRGGGDDEENEGRRPAKSGVEARRPPLLEG